MSDALQIQIDQTGNGVSAEALRVQLEQALRFLRADSEADESVDWRVTRVRMNSPLMLELERAIPEGASEPASRPGEQLARAFAQLSRGESPDPDLSLDRLHALEKMVGQANGVRQVRIRAALGEPIVLDARWAETVRAIRAERLREGVPPEQPYSTTGRLEGVNVHGNKSEFYVDDPLTDQRMQCLFPEQMLDEVGRSLGERVEVTGLTKFGPGPEPKSMKVESLRRIPAPTGSFLDRLDAAHQRDGVDLTGGLTAEEALDEVRGGPA